MTVGDSFELWKWIGILSSLYFFVFSRMMLQLSLLPSSFLDVKSSSGVCSDDLGCSLNGLCDDEGICSCDKPWSGDKCEFLLFNPVQFPQGYGMTPNHTTWGGGILVEEMPQEDKLYHLFVVRMTNQCSLEHWTHNSRIDHAISKSPTGPFKFLDVAIPTQSHNPVPLALPDGTFAIMHIGLARNGPNGGVNCSRESTGIQTGNEDDLFRSAPFYSGKGSTIHISDSLYGPWSPLSNSLGFCNNPSPAIHPNGTIFVGCRFGKPKALLKRAETIAGPYSDVCEIPHATENGDTLEDPHLYIDPRGHFHIIYHAYNYSPTADNCEDSLVSAHAFSVDGVEWHLAPRQPYGTEVELINGKSVIFATRERPKPFFQDGVMTHLVQAVCGSPNCNNAPSGCVDCKYKNWDFTFVSPLMV